MELKCNNVAKKGRFKDLSQYAETDLFYVFGGPDDQCKGLETSLCVSCASQAENILDYDPGQDC